MKNAILLVLFMTFISGVSRLHATAYQEGRVAEMHSVPCGRERKGHKRVEQVLCQEYTVNTGRLEYRIREHEQKPENLLPVGHGVQFRVVKNQMVVRGWAINGKKIKNQKYLVISERAHEETESAGDP